MVTNFVQQQRKQQILLFAFVAVMFVIGGIIWFRFFYESAEELSVTQVPSTILDLPINFPMLEHPIFDQLKTFRDPFPKAPEDKGRVNPYVPVE